MSDGRAATATCDLCSATFTGPIADVMLWIDGHRAGHMMVGAELTTIQVVDSKGTVKETWQQWARNRGGKS